MQTNMSNHSSAGARIHQILEKGSSLPDNTAVLKAWAVLFDIREPYDVELSVDVAERLVWLNQDLKRLRNSGHASDRPEPALRHIEQALSPVYLGSNWEVVKQFLSPDTLATFKGWAETVPDAEAAIDQSELDAIQAQAQELGRALNSSTLPEDLRLLMAEQAKLVRKAVHRYRLNGVRALQEAAFVSYGELVAVEETVSRHCDIPELAALIKLWGKVDLLASTAAGKGSTAGAQRDPWSHFCPDST